MKNIDIVITMLITHFIARITAAFIYFYDPLFMIPAYIVVWIMVLGTVARSPAQIIR